MAGSGLTRLTLSHFRSHRLTRLEPGGRCVVLHGANGAGKTNVLEAISMLSPGRGLRRAASDEMARTHEAVGWKVTAEIATPEGAHELETWAESGGARQVRIDGKAAAQAALAGVVGMLWLVPSMDRLWIEGADGRRRFLDRIALTFDAAHAENALSYDKAMRERNRLLRDQVADPHWYRALEAQMAASGARIDRARRAALTMILAAQAGAETAFPAAELVLRGPDGAAADPWTEDDLAAALADGRRADLGAGRTLAGPHRADLGAVYAAKGMPAEHCSTGEQKALLISLVLSNARALAARRGAAPVLLLDEVAAHLDPGRRGALYAEILGLGAQAWMTGTERSLFDGLEGRAAFCTVSETGGASEVTLEG